MFTKKITLIISLLFIFVISNAQDIDDLMNDASNDEVNYTTATFKSTRIINGHSVETVKKKHLDFRISHRFGTVNGGISNFFGIDQSTIHLGFDYGINNKLTIGYGRSSYNKTYDLTLKYKLLQQSTGKKNMPISMTYYGSTEIFSRPFANADRTNYFSSRLTYTNQLLIARKFNENLSLQIMPTYIHKNLTPTVYDMNDVFAMGIGGRYKITKRMALTAEYYYAYHSPRSTTNYHNPISIGIDIETGGHVFQIMLTNTSIMKEGGFIYGDDNGDILKGDIHLGFNISRIFSFK